MPKSVLDEPRFRNEEAAYAYVEAMVWPEGRICPHCGIVGHSGALKGKSTRIGTYKCYSCRKPFTVKVGTIFEKSHVPMHIWLQAIHILCSSKKGFSSQQFARVLGCDLKTAWFMSHRIREMMSGSGGSGPLGSGGAIVEADETWITKSPKTRRSPHERTKTQILSLVERDGPIRSQFLDHRSVRQALFGQLDKDAKLSTDSSVVYRKIMPEGQHAAVDHSKGEYVRGDVHTNTLEGFFSVLKRGLVGVYQHVDQKHLDRYLAEFDFRFNTRTKLGVNDEERSARAIKGAVGKRLTYRTTDIPF